MMYFLSKTVGSLFEPIAILWILLLIALIRSWINKDKKQAFFTGFLAFFITVIGGTKISSYLLSSLERPYIIEDLNNIPQCDAIVLLGGTHSFSDYGVNSMELGEAFDRVITAVELVRLKKGKPLLIGGGEYSSGKYKGLSGQLVKDWIDNWEITDSPVYVLDYSSNTRDEAMHTKKLAKEKGWGKIVLVTSASHMRRAEAVFSKTGLEVIPVGSDFKGISSSQSDYRIYDIIPGTEGFACLGNYLHEQIGWLYYKLRGWL